MTPERLQTPVPWPAPSEDWWYTAFPVVPYASKPPGPRQMLTLVAYDICNQRRLARVASVCEDFGVRVQYSIFECRLEPNEFERFWSKLLDTIDQKEDRVVAYSLDAKAARETRTAGTMICSEQVVCYLI
jgi:CRISPR-associated protein Cas2